MPRIRPLTCFEARPESPRATLPGDHRGFERESVKTMAANQPIATMINGGAF